MMDRTSREIDRRHVFYPWAAQARIEPVVVTGGAGARFTDDTGASYLDFASQLVHANLGLQHPRLVAALHRQVDRLCTVSPNHATDVKASRQTAPPPRTPTPAEPRARTGRAANPRVGASPAEVAASPVAG